MAGDKKLRAGKNQDVEPAQTLIERKYRVLPTPILFLFLVNEHGFFYPKYRTVAEVYLGIRQ